MTEGRGQDAFRDGSAEVSALRHSSNVLPPPSTVLASLLSSFRARGLFPLPAVLLAFPALTVLLASVG